MTDTTGVTESNEFVDNSLGGEEGLNEISLREEMVNSFKQSFIADWVEIRSFAEEEAKRLATMLMEIHQLQESGETSEERAKLLLSIQSDVQSSHLLAIKGLSKAAADSATQAALSHVRLRVNRALGFDLL